MMLLAPETVVELARAVMLSWMRLVVRSALEGLFIRSNRVYAKSWTLRISTLDVPANELLSLGEREKILVPLS